VKTLILATLTLSICSASYAGTSMKIEGSCTGTLSDGSAVSYTYYSNFNGCRKVIRAAVSFTSGIEGLFTGKRSFTDSQDIYVLNGGYKLIFANSTGNTSGSLSYPVGSSRKIQKATMQCEVRDYEYSDC
jgi:hypothetical protein